MSVSLSSLNTRLQAMVPARNGVPADYDAIIKAAAADYGQRRPVKRRTTINIVSGTATYNLPSDFQAMMWFEDLSDVDSTGTVITSDGALIPVGDDDDEAWEIVGGQIPFYPTPTFTQDRYLWYEAGHVLDSSSNFPLMTEADTGPVLLLAQAMALEEQASAAAQEAWAYTTGDQQVDKRTLAKAMQEQAKHLRQQYEEAVGSSVGPILMRG